MGTYTNQQFFGFGYRSDLGTTTNGEDIWPGAATYLPIPPQPGGEQMDIVSSSTHDTAGDIGVQTFEVSYIDSNGNQQDEIVTMNGTTPVPTVATNIRFVQDIHVETVGSNNAPVGTIQINTHLNPANIYDQLAPGHLRSSNTANMVPVGYTYLISSWSCSGGVASGGKSAVIELRSTSDMGIITPTNVFLDIDNAIVFNSSVTKIFDTPIAIPALAIVKVVAFTSNAGADVQASYQGKLVVTS